ncbi:MAG TPA: type III pantothenate kinase [Verrucomicrobiales bacterium]|nr:type III pantothenate kinase [Verrucomicrobiales bacterium]
MILLLDIGNTHTHVALANDRRVTRHRDLPTSGWKGDASPRSLKAMVGRSRIDAIVFCSVVPDVVPLVRRALKSVSTLPPLELTAANIAGVGVDYPRPDTIGADRLANAIAARHHFGCPSVVVDFGTAVTFDVVDRGGSYIGGIIAPGLAAMTDYLHEKTALLPRITIREPRSVVGRSTREAMLVGAVHGYRGLIKELIGKLQGQLDVRRLPVIATGGYARLISRSLREITVVEPLLTLEGLRLFHGFHRGRP